MDSPSDARGRGADVFEGEGLGEGLVVHALSIRGCEGG
jgi:hypothetical protein